MIVRARTSATGIPYEPNNNECTLNIDSTAGTTQDFVASFRLTSVADGGAVAWSNLTVTQQETTDFSLGGSITCALHAYDSNSGLVLDATDDALHQVVCSQCPCQ